MLFTLLLATIAVAYNIDHSAQVSKSDQSNQLSTTECDQSNHLSATESDQLERSWIIHTKYFTDNWDNGKNISKFMLQIYSPAYAGMIDRAIKQRYRYRDDTHEKLYVDILKNNLCAIKNDLQSQVSILANYDKSVITIETVYFRDNIAYVVIPILDDHSINANRILILREWLMELHSLRKLDPISMYSELYFVLGDIRNQTKIIVDYCNEEFVYMTINHYVIVFIITISTLIILGIFSFAGYTYYILDGNQSRSLPV